MKFYYANNIGDSGMFKEKDLVKAIHMAWNIEADLYLLEKDNKKRLIFSPFEDNDFNSELLQDYGYYVVDGKKYREIKEASSNKTIHYKWEDIIDLNLIG